MKRMKKIIAVMLLVLVGLTPLSAALADQGDSSSALDAFHALLASPRQENGSAQGSAQYLERIVSGAYSGQAADLQALSAISSKDITAYASANGKKVGQVRNAYYKALARALKEQIELNPANEAQYKNIQTILSLFLEAPDDGSVNREKEAIRSAMSRTYSQQIADQYQLPVAFVEFIIMSEDWDDDDWKNDDDWRDGVDWDDLIEDAFEDITIGSKDKKGSTRIADLQQMLIEMGYLTGKADGIFGPRTQSALIEFQMANGLAATGKYSRSNGSRLLESGVVSRWDYDDDFWDSRDYDLYDTPDAYDSPDYYDTPRRTAATPAPGTKKTVQTDTQKTNTTRRDTPDTPVERDTPKQYDTPNRDTPKKYDSPDRDT